jgi:hypothetical protein
MLQRRPRPVPRLAYHGDLRLRVLLDNRDLDARDGRRLLTYQKAL